MQKLYTKVVNGTRRIEPRNKIIINLYNRCIYCPTEDVLLEHGWVEYTPENIADTQTEETIEDDLSLIKESLKDDLLNHDSSSHVNIFYINGDRLWFNKTTRSNLIQRFNAEKYEGVELTKLWYNNIEYNLSVDTAIDMLYKLESYAAKCYDTTQKHLSNIDKLEDINEAKDYNYYSDYPTPLHFDI